VYWILNEMKLYCLLLIVHCHLTMASHCNQCKVQWTWPYLVKL